jgi:hypothetical protein
MKEQIPSRKVSDISYIFGEMIYDLCEKVDEVKGLSNGQTALYWELVNVISRHMGD